MTPTERSKKLLRDNGWTAAVVEKWNPHVRIRQDLWGFADVLAMKPGERPVLIQVTSGSNVAARRTKILTEASDHARTALESGFDIIIHGWRKVKVKRGGKAMRWEARVLQLSIEDFDQ